MRFQSKLSGAVRAATFAAALLGLPSVCHGATLLPGFTERLIASGLASPTAMAFAPDGRLFICQQGGSLRVVKGGVLLSAPFLTVTVDSSGERGLLGVAIDPAFESNHFIYIYYTATTPAIHNRVSRFTANGDVAVPGSEVPLLDLEDLSATNHNGGAIHFGPDGKLYVGVGENGVSSNAQLLTTRLGKMLRINNDGTIPSDNPTFSGQTAGIYRAIWAYGLRNPFTFAFHAQTGQMMIDDVGQSTWEEINDGIAGANYGWDITEGPTSDPRFVSPRFYYGHGTSSDTLGCAIAGGSFYDRDTKAFPAQYTNAYFFSDLCNGWIRSLDLSTNTATTFVTGLGGLVDLHVSRDGALYYLSWSNGTVSRVEFKHPFSDFDGDGFSDPRVFRPSTGEWYVLQSSNSAGVGYQWGVAGDVPVSRDYDGDGHADIAVYRPSTGTWFVIRSATGQAFSLQWGLPNDVPVPADYDGDGKADVAVYRPSTGEWYMIQSSTNTAVALQWGLPGDIPVPADFDGDLKADPTVFRPSTGTWYELRSGTGAGIKVQWGQNGDVPLPGDYDGDGKADPTVFRASTGRWYELRSTTGTGFGVLWGLPGDVPLVGDFDRDGKADPTVFRASEGTWYEWRSSTNVGVAVVWGVAGDIPR